MLPKLHPEMLQRGREYHTWIALCLALGVHRYVELGSWKGYSAAFAREAGIEKIVTVDNRPGDRPVGLSTDVYFIPGDSRSEETVREAVDFLGAFPQAVFIDADHSEESVRKDFELWWPYAETILGFHDIVDFNSGVGKVWLEISKDKYSVEIVARDTRSRQDMGESGEDPLRNCGIGVLFKR
jgi:hypothetical protein